MDAETATTVLTVLGTFYGVMFAAMIALMVASIRLHRRDNLATRQLIADTSKETRDLIERARKENRELFDEDCEENRGLIDRNHGTVIRLLGDIREQLARIEGHLGIGLPASDGDNREAA